MRSIIPLCIMKAKDLNKALVGSHRASNTSKRQMSWLEAPEAPLNPNAKLKEVTLHYVNFHFTTEHVYIDYLGNTEKPKHIDVKCLNVLSVTVNREIFLNKGYGILDSRDAESNELVTSPNTNLGFSYDERNKMLIIRAFDENGRLEFTWRCVTHDPETLGRITAFIEPGIKADNPYDNTGIAFLNITKMNDSAQLSPFKKREEARAKIAKEVEGLAPL